MASPTKVVQTEFITLQSILAGAAVKASYVLNSATKFASGIFWDFAPIANTATPVATELAIEVSQKLTGDDTWVIRRAWLSPSIVPSVLTQTAGGGIGASTITVASGTVTPGQHFYIKDSANVGEWARCLSQAGNVITVEDPFTLAHTGATIYAGGVERFQFDEDLTSQVRVRVVILNGRTGNQRDIVSRVGVITTDSVS